jgi:DNA-binding response OmpR family regulator
MTDTVLYVEDDDTNIHLVTRILKRRTAIDLVIATCGHHGLQLAHDIAPRLILLDRRLPDIPGNEVLRQLKASTRTAMIPVVVLSGDSDPEHTTELLHLGASAFLPKPFDVLKLLAIVDRFCG